MPKPAIQAPGIVLQSLLDEYQLNPGKLGEAIKLSQSAVRQVVIGKTRISVPVALRLAKYFGTTAEYWIDLQNKYDLAEAAKDGELSAVLKGIVKGKKPAPKKAAKPAAQAKKAPPKKASSPKPAAKRPAARKVAPQGSPSSNTES
ncbi:MAG: HigA family addiction module antidote protein [Treponema sp.]|jgi:addiction module HigA family antidote|nr:HigA family addiction module antidote protein [Treponema sp.]